eukprot:gene23696-29942_t
MYPMPSALTLTSSLLITQEMLSMKRTVNKVTPTNKQKRTPTNKDKNDILMDSISAGNNRKKTKAQLIFPVAAQPVVDYYDENYYQACVPVQLASSLLPVMTGDLSDISDCDFDFLMNFIDGDDATSPRPTTAVSTVQEQQVAAAKAKHVAEQLHKLKSKKILKKVMQAQKQTAPSVSIVIQKTDADHLCAIIPVLPLKLLDGMDDVSEGEDSRDSFGSDDFDFFNDDAYDVPRTQSQSPEADHQQQQHLHSVSNNSIQYGEEQEPSPTFKVTPTHAMMNLSISLPSLANGEAPPERKKRAYSRKNKVPQSSVLIAIDPATTKYVLKDNVLCAIVPVIDPAMIAAHAAATASEAQAQAAQSQKQNTLQLSDADLEMLMGGGEDEYSEGSTDGAATSGSESNSSMNSHFRPYSNDVNALPCPPETWSGVPLGSRSTEKSPRSVGSSNVRPFLLPPPMKMNRLNSLALETPLTFTDTNACISLATFELLSSLNPNQFMNFD